MISSFSGASMYNFNDEEEDDDGPTKEKVEENEQLKEKMKQIRLKMEKINISKKVSVFRTVFRIRGIFTIFIWLKYLEVLFPCHAHLNF